MKRKKVTLERVEQELQMIADKINDNPSVSLVSWVRNQGINVHVQMIASRMKIFVNEGSMKHPLWKNCQPVTTELAIQLFEAYQLYTGGDGGEDHRKTIDLTTVTEVRDSHDVKIIDLTERMATVVKETGVEIELEGEGFRVKISSSASDKVSYDRPF